jgi:hypothetical protein
MQASSMICERIPYAIEQGIFSAEQGIVHAEQGSRANEREAARTSSELPNCLGPAADELIWDYAAARSKPRAEVPRTSRIP